MSLGSESNINKMARQDYDAIKRRNMKKLYLHIVIIFFLTLAAHAQQNKNITLLNTDVIRSSLQGKYDLKNQVCENSITFIKFNINEKGNIINIDFSKGTPDAIKIAVKEKLSASNVFLQINKIDKEKMAVTTFIVPLVYMFKFNCPEGEVRMPVNENTMIGNEVIFKKFTNAFNNALNFENGRVNFINCILISPIIINP